MSDDLTNHPLNDLNIIPRRAEMTKWCPTEHAIYRAMLEVENMPADVRLTEAVTLLGAAKEAVADFVDGIDRHRCAVCGRTWSGANVPLDCPSCASPQGGQNERR